MGDEKSGTNYKNTDGGPEGLRHKGQVTGSEDTEGQSKSMAVGPEQARQMGKAVGPEQARQVGRETEPEDTEGQSLNSRTLDTAKSDDPAGPNEARSKQL